MRRPFFYFPFRESYNRFLKAITSILPPYRLMNIHGEDLRMIKFITTAIALSILVGLTAEVSFKAKKAFPGQRGKKSRPECDDRLKWWREARFGMFIHWGPVSLKGTEIGWSRGGERRGRSGKGEVPVGVYDNLYKQFNPKKFKADEWVKIAKEAGMKYLVFTTKHHDGFVNFDSKLTNYKITSPESPFRRDIIAELHSRGSRPRLLTIAASRLDFRGHAPGIMAPNSTPGAHAPGY